MCNLMQDGVTYFSFSQICAMLDQEQAKANFLFDGITLADGVTDSWIAVPHEVVGRNVESDQFRRHLLYYGYPLWKGYHLMCFQMAFMFHLQSDYHAGVQNNNRWRMANDTYKYHALITRAPSLPQSLLLHTKFGFTWPHSRLRRMFAKAVRRERADAVNQFTSTDDGPRAGSHPADFTAYYIFGLYGIKDV
jgi:hypothetical protein